MIQRIKKVLFASDLIMTYKLIRIDGKDDKLTAKIFDNYLDAYNLLEDYMVIRAVQMLIMET